MQPEYDSLLRLHTRLRPAPLVPEVLLHQADEVIPLWEATEGLTDREQPPPFWAFAWAGGCALSRWLLDHPDAVSGLHVLDVATGSGLCAVAAARAGAAAVVAADIDPLSEAAVRANATANGVTVSWTGTDLLAGPAPAVDVILAGDVWYERQLAPWCCRGCGLPSATGAGRLSRTRGAATSLPDSCSASPGTTCPRAWSSRTAPVAAPVCTRSAPEPQQDAVPSRVQTGTVLSARHGAAAAPRRH